jgi:predicted RNase H-like nuclease (RuvC/YqgF family)
MKLEIKHNRQSIVFRKARSSKQEQIEQLTFELAAARATIARLEQELANALKKIETNG